MSQRIIRIDSDGIPNNTVVSTDDGREIEGVTSVSWYLSVGSVAEISISVYGTAAHIKGHLDDVELTCPICLRNVEHKCKDKKE